MPSPVLGSEDPQPVTMTRRAMAAVSGKEELLLARRRTDPASSSRRGRLRTVRLPPVTGWRDRTTT